MLKEKLAQKLEARKREGLYRTRKAFASHNIINDKEIINFCNNDYLNLSKDSRLVEALKKTAEEYGVGGNGSGLVSGYRKPHAKLEAELSEFLQRDKVILFSTGYIANISALSALTDKEDFLFHDHGNHASLLDGGKFSQAVSRRYLHNNQKSLEKLLKSCVGKASMVITNGVFSTTGELAPLFELSQLANEYNSTLFVDDAHGIGVLGKEGGGTLEHLSLSQKDVPLLSCALSKAFGGYGGIVAGEKTLMEGILQYARGYCYSTALPPSLAAAMSVALNIVREESWRREKLQENIQMFKEKSALLGLPINPSITAIQSIPLEDPLFTVAMAEKLYSRGFFVSALRPPSVPHKHSLLRITLSCAHTKNQIHEMLETLSLFHTSDNYLSGITDAAFS